MSDLGPAYETASIVVNIYTNLFLIPILNDTDGVSSKVKKGQIDKQNIRCSICKLASIYKYLQLYNRHTAVKA